MITRSWMRAIGKKAVALGIFGLFPVAAFLGIIHGMVENWQNGMLRGIWEQQEAVLTLVKQADNSEHLLLTGVSEVMKRVRLAHPRQRSAIIGALTARFPGQLELYVFDGHGDFVPGLCTSSVPTLLLEQAWRHLSSRTAPAPGRANPAPSSPFDPETIAALRLPQLKGQIESFDPGQGYQASILHDEWPALRKEELSGFICIAREDALPPLQRTLLAIQTLSPLFPLLKTGLVDTQPARTPVFLGDLDLSAQEKSILTEGIHAFRTRFVLDFKMATLLPHGPHRSLVVVNQIPRPTLPIHLGIHLLCLLWLLLVFKRLPIIMAQADEPIPLRLNTLFLVSVGIPAGLLVVLGASTLIERKNTYLANTVLDVRETIARFDLQFHDERSTFDSEITGLLATRLSSASTTPLLDRLFPLASQTFFTGISLHDGSGRVRHCLLGAAPAFETVSRELGEIHRRAAGAPFAADDSQRGYGRFSPGLDRHRSLLVRYDPLPMADSDAPAFIRWELPREHLEERYCRRHLHRFLQRKPYPIEVNLCRADNGTLVIQHSPAEDRRIRDLTRQARSRGMFVSTDTGPDHAEILWLSMPGRQVSSFIFVCRVPINPIRDHFGMLFTRLLLFIALMILATAIIARTLSRDILVPLNDVSEGVKAIGHRDFAHQVPVHRADELGDLARLLNQVTSEMQDLEIARVVQESLFPPDGLIKGAFEVFGRSTAMTDIGGDYYDFFSIDEHRLVCLIGDVAGHGVPAALIMGIAKGAFSIAPTQAFDSFLSAFNRLLLPITKRKKMMTMFALALDVDTGVLTYANAGHNYPLLFSGATGAARFIKAPALPLGIIDAPVFKLQELSFSAEDAILLYTDGIVEALDPDGNQVGYTRLTEWFVAEAHQSAAIIVERLFEHLHTFTGGAGQTDDVTLVVLKGLHPTGESEQSSQGPDDQPPGQPPAW